MANTTTDDSRKENNQDLTLERSNASFNINEITEIIDGGVDKTKFRKEMEKLLFDDPLFKDFYKTFFKTRSELYEESIARGVKLFSLRQKYKWTDEQFEVIEDLVNHLFGMSLHFTMFIPSLERLATETQKAKWLPLATNFKILGTYAQTEMGHGTYLQGLETTATYDPVTEEFILNTPHKSSMKWWPGSLGKSSTHALVQAVLIINGKNYGMHPFMLQLRSLDNHMPLPGIEVGDIGPKMTVNYNDNGFLLLKNVRIPRQHMLMKHAQVSSDGKYTSSGPNKAIYATMVLVRVKMTKWVHDALRKAITTAVRYSAVRHQSKMDDSGPEPQILDYQTQQYKLFPVLADTYALFFMSRNLRRQYNRMMEDIRNKGSYKMLAEIHSISCGLKGLSSKIGIDGASICRTACGGHGYLMVAGISEVLGLLHSVVTAEGEYTVVCLQTARYLMKQIAKVSVGEVVTESCEYLNVDPQSFSCPLQTPADCFNLTFLCDIFRNRANSLIRSVASRLQIAIESGTPQHIAMNNNLQSLVRVAEAHSETIMVLDFTAAVTSLRTSPETIKVLTSLCQLHALHTIVKHAGDFMETESVGLEQIKWIREQELKLLEIIRPNAVALVDAFDLHDDSLGSLLGVYDGNVYERLYESTKYNPMNQNVVHPSYHKYLKPLMSGEMISKL
ncbi:peroxisomal acyl-coenzyme A oxidase 1-like [Mytilus edulis]|uniref:Acyl-coenzyme A oxidase n=1 Tax=Mytilus edulis TaxID=6550 RepID=A0A8S3V4R1_MYTED|nr:ACOX1 [Mytilus edulis]